jgi:hypothetical protein
MKAKINLKKKICSYKLRNNGSIVFWYVTLSGFEEPALSLFMAEMHATCMIIHAVILQETTIIVHTL